MFFSSHCKFRFRAEFVDFVHNEDGKRRMLVRIGERELEVKVPKEIRRLYAPRLVPGQAVELGGIEERQAFSGKIKYVVSDLWILDEPVRAVASAFRKCSVLVCTKKNCWKNGGRELWEVLSQKIDGEGLAGAIVLKGVDCLDHCKHGPNIESNGSVLEHCTPQLAERLVDGLAAGAGKERQCSR